MKIYAPGRSVFALLAMLLTFYSCSELQESPDPSDLGQPELAAIPSLTGNNTGGLCGDPVAHPLLNGSNVQVGTVTVSNDETHLFVTFQATNGNVLQQSFLYVGNCNSIPSLGSYPYQTAHTPTVTSFMYSIPLTGLDSCYCISARAETQNPALCPRVIDFDTDGNGNPLLSGTIMNTQYQNMGVTISVDNNRGNGPDLGLIFDSSNPTGGDWDLGTPHTTFGGPGVGTGGAIGQPGKNDRALNNLLIIAENDIDANNDGRVDNPDDEAQGGRIAFEFSSAVTVESALLVDVDSSETGGSLAYTELLTGQTYNIPILNLGDNSVQELPLNLTGITRLELSFVSSGAIAELRFCPEEPAMAAVFTYCTQACDDDCEIEVGDYRTQTQGGWGSRPNGNNPGAYLHANFAGAFPNGLQVGCNYVITLTSATAVTNMLPEGGPPSALSQDYTDPVNTGTVLAGQVVALTLSVTFDRYDPNFGASSTHLGDLVIANGPFQGWTVDQVLAEATALLGGCSSAYTASQLNDAVSAINENFVDGTMVGNYLICPETPAAAPSNRREVY